VFVVAAKTGVELNTRRTESAKTESRRSMFI
jgi:hypothetical protein